MPPDRPTRHDRRTVYSSDYVALHLDRVQMPGGLVIDDYHVVDFPSPAVGVLVFDEADRLLMIEAYRYPTDSIGWEIPAGRIDVGETTEDAAARETFEETGYAVSDVAVAYRYRPMAGMTTADFYVAVARAANREGDLDPNEVRQVRWVTRTEVADLVARQAISDGLSLTALLLLVAGIIDR